MTVGQLLMAFTLGTAVIALWSYVRWPEAAPTTMKGASIRVLIAVALIQLGVVVMHAGIGAAPAAAVAIAVLVGTLVPVLTYAFLAALWFMKVCADQLRGAF